LDCQPKIFKSDKIQTKIWKIKSKQKICEIQIIENTDFLIGSSGFLKESGRFKPNNSEIQVICRENPNKNHADFLFFWILDWMDD
jgi:hypothetical protein